MSTVPVQPQLRDPAPLRSTPGLGAEVNLPRPLTSFVGRETEIAAVRELLARDDVQLVTLSGSGGVGKTRLALQVAESVDKAADGRWFVSLASCSDPSLVPTIIAGVLGVPPGLTKSAELELTRHLARRESLLVLDNLEQILATGTYIAALLAACPQLKILATSRRPLRVSGEHVYSVSPLLVPVSDIALTVNQLAAVETVELFVERAQASLAGFALTPVNAPLVAEICRQLDGLPLAIELAAARTPVLPLPVLLERLATGLGLLAGGPRDAPARQQTMSSAIGWSYDLLGKKEQELFRRLGVFVGGFTLDAATQVVGQNETDVLDGLMSLVASSLVDLSTGSRGEPRYLMLETIREFALHQLADNGETTAVRRAHGQYFTSLTEAALPHYDCPDLPVYIDRINGELGNCRIAMEWALANQQDETSIRLAGAIWRGWFYPQATGERPWLDRVTEGRKWLENALMQRDGWPVEALTEAMMGASYLAFLQGDLDRGEILGKELFTRSQLEAYAYGEYWAHILLGSVSGDRGRPGVARRHFEEAIAIAPGIRDPCNQQAFALMTLGELETQESNWELAIARFSEAFEINQGGGNPCIASHCKRSIGTLSVRQGNYGRAVPLLRESIAMDRDLDLLVCVAESLCSLAQAAIGIEHNDQAVRLLAAMTQLPILPDQQAEFDEILADARKKAGEPAFGTAWDAGQRMGWDALQTDIDSLAESVSHMRSISTSAAQNATKGLTRREIEVLQLLTEGRSNRSIAESLSLSERTVDNHVLHILTKLQLESRTAVATYAVRNGLA